MTKKSEIIWPFPPFMSYANWEYNSPDVRKQKTIFESLLQKPLFQRMVSAVREKRKVNPILTKEIYGYVVRIAKLQKILNSTDQIKVLDKKIKTYYHRINPNDVINIINEFNLPYLWYGIINQYILQGKVSHLIGVKCEPFLIKDNFNKTRILIEIFPDTTLKDIHRSWERVQWFQKEYPEYRRKNKKESRNADKHDVICAWYKAGKSTSETIELVERQFPNYIVNEETYRKIKERGNKKTVT